MRLKHSRGMLTPVTKAVTIFLCFLTLSIENVTIFRESAQMLTELLNSVSFSVRKYVSFMKYDFWR